MHQSPPTTPITSFSHWDSNGKYVTFVVEAAATDADLSDRLSERGGLPDPWDLWLLGVRWIALRDLLSEKWCKANMATHHHHLLRLLWPHLRALQKSATGITAKPRSPLLSSPSSSRSSISSTEPRLAEQGEGRPLEGGARSEQGAGVEG